MREVGQLPSNRGSQEALEVQAVQEGPKIKKQHILKHLKVVVYSSIY